jgi:hypothetical protein
MKTFDMRTDGPSGSSPDERIRARARADAMADAKRAVGDDTAQSSAVYREAYADAFQRGVIIWATLRGKSDAAKAAQVKRERQSRSRNRSARAASVQWHRGGW